MIRGLRTKVILLFGITFVLIFWVLSIRPLEPWGNYSSHDKSLQQMPSIQSPIIDPTFPKKLQRKGSLTSIRIPATEETKNEIPTVNNMMDNEWIHLAAESGEVPIFLKKGWNGNKEDLNILNIKREQMPYHKLTRVGADEINVFDDLNLGRKPKGFTEDSFRVFHLDLKGAPPSLDYLRNLLPILAAHGCDSLLIEYEDMFPYTDSLVNISAKNAYKRQEIRKLLSWAHDLSMEVIPLVQTFGHLEHALKLNDWKHLRELPDFPSDLCPSRPGSIQLVENMISQVISLHQGLKYIHIGGDEVIHLGACSECSRFNPWVLYSKHITEVAQLIHRKYPGVTPIIWDDMMRQWNPEFLTINTLGNIVEVMVWDYGDVDNLISPFLWYWYNKTFKRIWVASAFKGAEMPTADLPNLQARFRNTKAWLKKIEKAQVPIAGFVLTGWSRYDHFAVLCELLPSSVPSLLLNLIAISRKHVSISDQQKLTKWWEALKCSSTSFTLENVKDNHNVLTKCNFPGVEVYEIVLHYLILRAKTDTLYDTMTKNKAWLTPYNVKHNFSNVWRLVQDYTYLKTYSLLLDIRKFNRQSKTVLLKYFDIFGTNEWLEQRVLPLDKKLESLGHSIEKLLNTSTWPRRPVL